MNSNRPYQRKLLNLSIKRDMQFLMIGKIFFLLLVSLLLSSVVFYYFANQEVTSSFQLFHVKARNFLDFLLPVVISSFVISLVVGAIGSLFFPKSLAGGVYRIEQDLQRVLKQGDLTVQITLREGDQVVSLAGEINALLSDFRSRIGRVDQIVTELEHVLTEETSAPGNADLQKVREICESLRSELRGLNY